MLFNSWEYFVFLFCIVAAYYTLPARFRWILLLLTSAGFYMTFIPKYILILIVVILIDYVAALFLERTGDGKKRKALLLMSIFANIGILFLFKYFNFFNENVTTIAHALHWNYSIGFLRIALPIGLSFHTFQSLSYVIEVYNKRYTAERHLGRYALYVLFFPQLVAGPIERPQHLLPQLHESVIFKSSEMTQALQTILLGFIKKMVIADNAALIVNSVYSQTTTVAPPALLVAIFFFAFQIYGDFSGYSDIAIGSAKLLGINLSPNFNRPYFSRSVAEFWRRWHISLSNWLRDYVYSPLAFRWRKLRKWGGLFATMVTFLLSGLWHGAGWTFVAMGAYFGSCIVIGNLTKPLRDRLVSLLHTQRFPRVRQIVQTGITFVLVCVGWVFFRANTLSDAMTVLRGSANTLLHPHMFLNPTYLRYKVFVTDVIGMDKQHIAEVLVFCLALFAWEFFQDRIEITQWFYRQRTVVRWTIYYVLIMSVLFFAYFGKIPFIYFKF